MTFQPKTWCLVALFSLPITTLLAQHDHGDSKVKAPRIFLDKSARIVEYQLKRLSNEQLLAVETATDDKKYLPVFNAILTREGMSRAYRESALEGMVEINASNPVTELANALSAIKGSDESASRTVQTLAKMLLGQPQADLASASEQLVGMTESGRSLLAPVGYGGLLAAEQSATAWKIAAQSKQTPLLLTAISLIPSVKIRESLHSETIALTSSADVEIQRSAIEALAFIPSNQAETYLKVASLIRTPALREAAVKTLLAIPVESRNTVTGEALIQFLVKFAEETEPEKRTEDSFLDAMQLVDQLLAKAPSEMAKAYRTRLSETVVRVVRVHTVEEEMRYDIPYFAVEAGRPVQVVLINEDLMPHNLVICQPGSLKEVADEGLAAGPKNGLDGKQYVPKNENVLFATNMIGSLESERLTFDAPKEPGEYPYVCTFPRHWMRMYGVMVVVEDLDAWLKNPQEPKDPIGSNRSFVQSWTVKDFSEGLEQGLQGRSDAIGERIFTEATCAQCHKLGGFGIGNVGPALDETFAKLKGDDLAVLQEIVDPSHRIDEKYAVRKILDYNGRVLTGLVISEDKDKVLLLENPEAKEPTEILQDDIEQMVKTSNSMMPKGLMDRFSKDEILELLSFIKNQQKK